MMSFSPAVVSGTENLRITYFGEMAVGSACPLCPQSEFPPWVQKLRVWEAGTAGASSVPQGLVLLLSRTEGFPAVGRSKAA